MHEGRIMGLKAHPLSRRNLLIGASLLGTAALARGMVPSTRFDLLGKDKLEKLIPNEVGPWQFASKSGLVIPPQDQLSKQIYDQLLTRVYTSPDRLPMMLLVAQSGGQDGVLQVHRPEFCYPASGYKLDGGEVHDIAVPGHRTIATRTFIASGVDRIEQLVYWTRVGRDLPTSWAQQRLSVAEANLRGIIPDAVLVRISTTSPDPSALAQIDEFVRTLTAVVPAKMRQVLGAATA